ncbi:MAG TPA: cupin domain-containing protein [Gaiellaceae bacterium]|jgi:quercetin dioxygenase-like cupin family protein
MSPAVERHGSFDALDADEPFPGVERRVVEADGATVARYVFAPGGAFPRHVHPQEQVTIVEAGEVELDVEGERTTLGAGDWSVVPGGIAHGITAGAAGAAILAIVVPRRASADEYTLVE